MFETNRILAGSLDDRIELEGTGGWRGVGDQDVVYGEEGSSSHTTSNL